MKDSQLYIGREGAKSSDPASSEVQTRPPTSEELLSRVQPIVSHVPPGYHHEPKATDLSPVKPIRPGTAKNT